MEIELFSIDDEMDFGKIDDFDFTVKNVEIGWGLALVFDLSRV